LSRLRTLLGLVAVAVAASAVAIAIALGRLRPRDVRPGDVLTLRSAYETPAGKRGDEYGVVKVVSLDGAGCCLVLDDYLDDRPRRVPDEVIAGVPMGSLPFASVAAHWRDAAPRRVRSVPVTDADRRACERFGSHDGAPQR
jgi:hypothetical protein